MRGGIAPVSNLPSYSVSGVRGERTIQALHSVAHPAGGVLVGCGCGCGLVVWAWGVWVGFNQTYQRTTARGEDKNCGKLRS